MTDQVFYQCCSDCAHGFQMPEHRHTVPCPAKGCVAGRTTSDQPQVIQHKLGRIGVAVA